MSSVPRVRRRLSAVLLSIATVVALLIVPLGSVATAASTSSSCPSGEGTQCILKISGPESVQTGVPFTVQVLVTTDGTTVAKSDPCASKVPVTLALTDGESTISTQTVNASAGIATFSLTISNDGSYDLNASASPNCSGYYYVDDSRAIMAVTIPADQPIAPCPDNVSCTQVTNTSSGGGSGATLIADTGMFTASFIPPGSVADTCGAPADTSTNSMLMFDLTAPDPRPSKTIILALASRFVNKGIGQFNICWTSINPFTSLSGATVTTGLLPACRKDATGPCVLFKKSSRQNVGFFGVLAPPGDPTAYAR